jgi:nucleoid-associated protein YgaU
MTRWEARFACGILFFLLLTINAVAGMTYDEYKRELAALQKREKNAKEQVASEQAHLESLKTQNTEIGGKIVGVRKETLFLLGVTEKDIDAAQSEIGSIRQQLETVEGLSPEEARNHAPDIEALVSRLSNMKKKSVFFIWKIRDLLLATEEIAVRVKALTSAAVASPSPEPASPVSVEAVQGTASAAGSYTVRIVSGKHESLFQIAGQDSVLGDPKKWKRLYDRNKEKIDKQYQMYLKRNPKAKYLHPEDLIFPGQVLEIPR